MGKWWALIVAVEDGLETGFGTVPYAMAGAEALAQTWEQAGINPSHQFRLFGSCATKTVIESRLRKLRKSVRRGDSVLVYWRGRGFTVGESSTLTCWDSLADDLPDTALTVADLATQLTRGRADNLILLLDVDPTPVSLLPADAADGLNADDLTAIVGKDPRLTILTATTGSESSHAAARLKSSLWTHLLTEAFRGQLTGASVPEPLTVHRVHEHLTQELPRLMRQHLEPGVAQTPQLYAVTDSNPILPVVPARPTAEPQGLLDRDQLRRVVFRSTTTTRVKDLGTWKKTFDLPTAATASASKFVARLAASEVKADLDALVARTREERGTRRKDLMATVSEGIGSLRTPDFEYSLTVALDPEQPTQVVWLREVGGLSNPAFVRGDAMERVFRRPFEHLVFEFVRPVDVPAWVDRFEEQLPTGVQLEADADATECVVKLKGVPGSITVRRTELLISGRGGSTAGLLELFLAFLRRVGPLGEPLALPAPSSPSSRR